MRVCAKEDIYAQIVAFAMQERTTTFMPSPYTIPLVALFEISLAFSICA